MQIGVQTLGHLVGIIGKHIRQLLGGFLATLGCGGEKGDTPSETKGTFIQPRRFVIYFASAPQEHHQRDTFKCKR